MAAKKRACVFAGSSSGNDPLYVEHATLLGEELAKRGYDLVYGGGSTGLMGACSKAVHKGGGKVFSVIPEPLAQKEAIDEYLGHVFTTADMHSRKEIMSAISDIFVALPGGLGTQEELAEMICWSQLGIQRKPVGLVNTLGFYDHILAQMDRCIAAGFTQPRFRGVWHAAADPAAVLDLVEAAAVPEGVVSSWKAFPAGLAAMVELEELDDYHKFAQPARD